MNRFVHRILKSSTASSICSNKTKNASSSQHHAMPSVHQLVQELQHAKLLYFGEFHSESRIITFQTELIKEWAKRLASSIMMGRTDTKQRPRIHLIMEHFSTDMQSMLDRYVGAGVHAEEKPIFPEGDDEAFEQLLSYYKNEFGTEGHDLQPYKDLLQFCRSTTRKEMENNNEKEDAFCNVRIHGGFIPRNHAARLNKECPDVQSKQSFFDEMSTRGYLPKEGDAMYGALFADDTSTFKLRGSPEHQLLVQSLMKGTDLYSPSEVEARNSDDKGGDDDTSDEETPLSRIYQAQLLKDHAMGYRIASLMLDHYQADTQSLASDRYIVIAGFGHLKHYLGVPDCVNGYLRQEAMLHPNEQRRAAAMDLLLNMTRQPLSTESNNVKFGGKGSALIGCQMMYEAYLEDSYPPMIDASKEDDEEEEEEGEGDEEDNDASDELKRKLLKDLYLQHPQLLDEYILKSQEVSGPLLNYANGIAGFEQPCADYLFLYDEDDENVIDGAYLNNTHESKCPFQSDAKNKDAKDETAQAYEQVGKTAGMKGNVARARAIMSQIGYTEEDMAYIGDDDLYNFQGVANPHSVANIKRGEVVLDIGSGLGIDSFLAMRDSGADANEVSGSPFVVGVDLAQSEVNYAAKRASERGYNVPKRIQFIRGDVEKLDEAFSNNNLQMETFDVCISNGAFCLVPDKLKAFANVYKALTSGGRMAISTTTIVSDSLDPSFEWPVCMRMFASLESIKPMCERIGFKNVRIIDAESPMEDMEIPVDEEYEEEKRVENKGRFKIHGKYADQFTFLENMDMDKLCKVVTVYGEKP